MLIRSFLCLFLFITSSFSRVYPPLDREKIARELEHSLKADLLDKFYPRSIDREHGGFVSRYTFDWKPEGSQDKMIVSQARHTWTPSKAAQLYPNEPLYRTAAQHGYAFLRDVMWDKTHGGFYTLVTKEGTPKEPEAKTAYGNAFGIYALAAYYQLSGDTAALNLAKKAFHWLDQKSHDPVHKGYFQNLTRNGTPVIAARPAGAAAPNKELGYKDQNSSIHLLEAFTELYSVWPDDLVRERLQEMLFLIRDKIVTEKGYLTLYLTPDLQPISYRDSAESVRKANHRLDHVSFGHDVETAYLLLEASHTLGLKEDKKTRQIAKKMVDHALDHGWDEKLGGFYDQGYYYRGKEDPAIIHDAKNWWSQAEGLNTLLLMTDEYPNDPRQYAAKFQKQWDYIKKYMLDATHGGWYEGGLDTEPFRKTGPKAHLWKANYHESRSLLNSLQRLRPDKTPPAKPAEVQAVRTKQGVLLQWQKVQDNQSLLGYDIYQNGKKIGFTPLTQFLVSPAPAGRKSSFQVVAKDLALNHSASRPVNL
jgi:mannobiose 2-epimerase